MNNQDYEKARQECWDALRKELLNGEVQWEPVSRKEIFNFAFDRAYALGKVKDLISQDEIDEAAEDYVSFKKGGKCYPNYIIERACCRAFKDGANFALGKQEKDTEKKKSPKFKIGDKVRVKYPPCKGLIGEIDSIGDRILEYHLSGNERLENVYFAESCLELVQDADAVIQGWVARDQDGQLPLFIGSDKPYKKKNCRFWCVNLGRTFEFLPEDSFPDLTWDDEPQECEIIIKRKKNEH